MPDTQLRTHWDSIYERTPPTQTGWYEESPEASLRLLASCDLNSDDLIVDAGAGVSTFVEALLAQGHMNITAIDISAEALGALRARLGQDAARVNYVVADLAHDNLQLRDVALWHDRAVLHFFTNPADRETYLATIRRALRSDGYAIIATFAPAGAPQCSGLDVTRYDPGELTELMGSGFELVEAFDYLYQRPDGDVRPFTYTLFRRVGVEPVRVERFARGPLRTPQRLDPVDSRLHELNPGEVSEADPLTPPTKLPPRAEATMTDSDPVVHVTAAERAVEGPAAAGMVRERAFDTDGLWAGLARTEAGMDSGWHHHGDHESVIFVLSGTLRMESGPGGGEVIEAGPGDFLYVPRGAVHRELNTGDVESQIVVTRAGTGTTTTNVDGPAGEP